MVEVNIFYICNRWMILLVTTLQVSAECRFIFAVLSELYLGTVILGATYAKPTFIENVG